MKSVALSLIAIVGFASLAVAGPNAGGTLIIVSSGEIYCAEGADFCGTLPFDACPGDELARYDSTDPIVLHVMAAFPEKANPRVAGVTFGVAYNEAEVFLITATPCGDFELSTENWPASGEGTAITFSTALTDRVNEISFFAAYNYYGNPNTFDLIPHPTQPTHFVDDEVHGNLDEVAALGYFGFSTDGDVPCPDASGACCFADSSCEVLPRDDCEATPDGIYLGDGTVCDPNPCGTTPTVDSSWGEVKSVFQ